jgi:hypothetical protein
VSSAEPPNRRLAQRLYNNSPLALFSPVKFGSFFLRWENSFPVILHADDRPAFGLGFIEAFVELADV